MMPQIDLARLRGWSEGKCGLKVLINVVPIKRDTRPARQMQELQLVRITDDLALQFLQLCETEAACEVCQLAEVYDRCDSAGRGNLS